MFKRNSKKIVVSVLAIVMVLGTVVLAAEGIYNKQITATYGRIKFNYEGTDVTSQIESKYDTPAFTSGDRAYAPVRAIADLLGVDIEYNHNNHTAYITDNRVEEYEKRLAEKDEEIARREQEIEEFKEEIKKLKEGVVDKEDLKSLEKTLNNRYGDYEDLEFDIALKESKDKITIDINTDLSYTRDEQKWIKMRYADKKGFIEDIVSDVKKSFKDVSISGSLYDSYSRKDLFTFSQTRTGSLSISNKDYIGDGRYDDYRYDILDDIVYDEFRKEGIYDARLYDSGYNYRDYFEIEFEGTSDNRNAWYDLTRDSVYLEKLLNYIAGEIEYEYNYSANEYVGIDVIMAGSRVATLDRNGRLDIIRY